MTRYWKQIAHIHWTRSNDLGEHEATTVFRGQHGEQVAYYFRRVGDNWCVTRIADFTESVIGTLDNGQKAYNAALADRNARMPSTRHGAKGVHNGTC